MSIRVAALAGELGAGDAVAEVQPKGLPEGGVLLADGRVRLALAYPDMAVFRTRKAGNEAVDEERFESVVFHRLTGKDLRDSMRAGDGEDVIMLFAGSTRLGGAKARALYDAMDATDAIAVGTVLRFLSTRGDPSST